MRKMFRMKFESCNGECYAYSDVMKIHTLGLDVQGAAAFLRRLLAIHAPACGNAQLQFRLDVDDNLGVFVASFYRYGALDLFASKSPREALDKMIDAALAYYDDQGMTAETSRFAVCHHGEDYKLVDFALQFSGLSDADQQAIRRELAL